MSKFSTWLNGLTEDVTPDMSNDLVVTYDASAATSKKVKLVNVVSGGLADGTWTDYSSTSTITGSASWVTKQIFYKQVGKTIYVAFTLITASVNTATMTFTVPVAAAAGLSDWIFPYSAKDVSTYAVGMGDLHTGASVVTLYKDPTYGAFAGSGAREVYGQFWYVTT